MGFLLVMSLFSDLALWSCSPHFGAGGLQPFITCLVNFVAQWTCAMPGMSHPPDEGSCTGSGMDVEEASPCDGSDAGGVSSHSSEEVQVP